MKVFENHFNGNITVVIGNYCSNGCQLFHINEALDIFDKFEVPNEYRHDVMDSFSDDVGEYQHFDNWEVRCEIARHNVPEFLSVLVHDPNWLVRYEVARHNIPELLAVLVHDDNIHVREKANYTLWKHNVSKHIKK